MAAYLISESQVLKPELLDAYIKISVASIEKYGGKYLVVTGATDHLEGEPPPKGIVLIEFPDMETARKWYKSPEYGEALKISATAMKRRLFLVDGVAR